MTDFWRKFKLDIVAISFLSLTLPLFFYKLGQSSLVSWDEAWYAEIARNIVKTGDLLNLHFGGGPYYDHPPAGFWLIAISFKIFGVNEFWARFSPALAGFLAVVCLYFLGKELFNRVVGFCSALALCSSFWFLSRARSGNLDSILTMFFLLTLLLALKAKKDKKFILPFFISLGFLFLTKTLVPVTILPTLALIFFDTKIYQIKDLVVPFLIFISLVGSWFWVGISNHADFKEHYLGIGLPGIKAQTSYLDNLKLMKEYLHNGIGKWFWPGILTILLSFLSKQRRFFILIIFFLTFFLPFIFSNKGHIWHLIPLHPIMIIAFFGFFYVILAKTVKNIMIINTVIFIFGLYFSLLQIRQIWYQFIDIPRYISDEAILSKEASNYPYTYYISGEFIPTATFYSSKNVKRVTRDDLKILFNSSTTFVLFTQQWELDEAEVSKNKYKILKKDRDKLLILKI